MRPAFTLMEMMVAIVIISLLCALTLAFLPSTEQRLTTQGADQLQTYIASVRARAMRDNLPTGIRFLPDTTVGQTGGPRVLLQRTVYRQFQVIQSPEPYAPVNTPAVFYNQIPLALAIPVTNPPTICLMMIPGDLTSIISIGDLLETVFGIDGQEQPAPWQYPQTVVNLAAQPSMVNRVVSVTAIQGNTYFGLASAPAFVPVWLQRTVNGVLAPVSVQITLNPVSPGTNAGFRFIREPRPLMGETTLQLPRHVRVDGPRCQNLNTQWSFQVSPPTYDIIFSPSGQIVNATGGRVVLWIDDDNGISQPTLLCVYARTGGIAAHPVAPGDNPYAFTQDGLNSGQ